MSELTRRKTVAVGASLVCVGLAGCTGSENDITVSVPAESQYFESARYERDTSLLTDLDILHVRLTDQAVGVDRVLLLYDGTQKVDLFLATGETRVSFATDGLVREVERSTRISLAVVTGGREQHGKWTGGDILERVDIGVQVGGRNE